MVYCSILIKILWLGLDSSIHFWAEMMKAKVKTWGPYAYNLCSIMFCLIKWVWVKGKRRLKLITRFPHDDNDDDHGILVFYYTKYNTSQAIVSCLLLGKNTSVRQFSSIPLIRYCYVLYFFQEVGCCLLCFHLVNNAHTHSLSFKFT